MAHVREVDEQVYRESSPLAPEWERHHWESAAAAIADHVSWVREHNASDAHAERVFVRLVREFE